MNQNEKLKRLRATLGLTQHDLAQRIGVSESSVNYFEAGKHSEGFTSGARAKIIAYMKAHENNENWELILPAERKSVPDFSFNKGSRYRICDSELGFAGDTFNPLTGNGCVFIYLRKDGKHHIFREQRGGWTRTYTDVQLMGKHVQEV